MSFFTHFRSIPARGRATLRDDLPFDDGTGEVSRRRRVVAGAITVLAVLLVLFALVAPNELGRLTPGAFARIPVEGLIVAALVLILPGKARLVLAALAGVLLGLLSILKLLDMGFFAALDRPFDPVFDWAFFSPAMDFLTGEVGKAGAIAAVIGVGLLAVALVVLMTLSGLRLTRLAVGHRTAATRTLAVLGVVWILCATFGVQLAPGEPVASSSAAALTYDGVRQVGADLRDRAPFAAASAADAFRDTPPEQLLNGLRGKDVLFTFVESYGRVALEGSDFSPKVDAALDAGTARLRDAGFASRSAFLTSPTAGGGSWLAHSTLQSGLWVNNQQRYNDFVGGARVTLGTYFRRAGWKTVGDVPAHTKDWPEGKIYNYSQYYDARNVGYRGPGFSYATMPDQYTMSAFQHNERSQPGHAPVMAEIDLVSSHTPWTPLPTLVDWNTVGDGSVFAPQPAAGKAPESVWPDPAGVRAVYGQSIEYSVNTLVSYVQTYGDDNLVLVFLGDHQPSPIAAGNTANRDVPITIVARDPAVLNRISGWGWQDGLRPDPHAPVWPMSDFRDKFLTAFAR